MPLLTNQQHCLNSSASFSKGIFSIALRGATECCLSDLTTLLQIVEYLLDSKLILVATLPEGASSKLFVRYIIEEIRLVGIRRQRTIGFYVQICRSLLAALEVNFCDLAVAV